MKQSNDELINEAATVTKSDNPLVHALWNVQGVAIWYRTGGRRGLSLEQAQATLLSNIAAHTEQAVLAARIDAVRLLIETFEDTGASVTLDRICQFQAGQLIAADEISKQQEKGSDDQRN